MNHPNNFKDLIGRWPSDAVFSTDIGARHKTVIVWKHRNSIPREYWKATADAAKRRGIKDVNLEVFASLVSV